MPQLTKNATATKILNKSIELFNNRGVHQISVQRISDELKLSSVGNITYYFPKKNELVHAIIDRLETGLVEHINSAPERFKSSEVPIELVQYLIELLNRLWDYRFVFNDMAFLSSEDELFGRRFLALQNHVLEALYEAAKMATDREWMLPVSEPNSMELVVQNQWNIWLRSLSAAQLKIQGVKNTPEYFIQQSLIHYYSLMQPHVTAEVAEGMHGYIQKKFPD